MAALLAVPGAAVSLPASATEPAAPLAVEAFGYPDAAKILAEQNLTLKAGDGNIRLADCASESGLVRVVRQVAAPYEVCFKITGPSGYLALETPNVINIKGDSHAIKATLSTEGATSNVDITKNDWTPVGQADNSTGNKPAVLLELVATDGTAAATPAPEFPAVGSIAVGAPGRAGSRGCTGTLVDPLWVLTSAGCFTDAPDSLAAGAPGVKSSFTAGGRSVDIVELVPRGDRDTALARLATPISGVAPLKAATAAATGGSAVKVAGFGRTATSWGTGSGPRTTNQTIGAISATAVDLSPATGAAPVCAGDTGAPVVNTTGEITGVVSRAWQAGCLGTPASETRTGAQAARVDDLGAWITPQTSRVFDLLNPASGRCLNLAGAGPWGNENPVIAFDCTLGADNEKFRITADGQLRNPVSGRCLNVKGAGPTWDNGTPIILFDCVAGAGNEKFEWTADGQIRNPASGRCINVAGAGPTWPNNTPVILFDCKGDPNEKFRPVADNEIPSAVGQLRNVGSGRCLNLTGAGPTWDNNTPVILWDCKGDANEQFRLTADGQLLNYVSGRCLNVKGAGPTWDNGTPIILFDCVAGAANEKFEWTADGQLRNPASGRCINVAGAGPVWNNGNPIILFDCKGDPNEKFELVSVKA
ncbi:ricin-type beta-trefoil lectin domain protein [Kitasatospora cheerisanensis]|uniref:Peptidase S1 domain-containing protein n=1 Tax=Kitasatospora cheerisanensis KCTC 2395 TaxID=1348663 RepID=A0A066YGM8_9ACTN|nr:ricin-type beta-trefoil lectin domain protein [Kitasatospora cheerisanensis]KDN80638.1 hypothetical protein KCH_76140 [Kitasatospora cheerisanensis KCTC 2395]